MTKTTFHQWLAKQTDHDGAVGDLARDVVDSGQTEVTPDALRDLGVPGEVIDMAAAEWLRDGGLS